MNIETVVIQVNRLCDNYNPEYASKARDAKIKLFHDELQYLNDHSLQLAVDEILKDANIKKFPTIAQIKGYIPRNNNMAEEIKDCDHCRNGLTWIWQYKEKLGSHYQIAYACPFCEAGRVKQKTFPLLPIEYHSIPFEVLRKNPECQTN